MLLMLMVSIGLAIAQNSKVHGIVLSTEDNEPIIGANVTVKGTTLGTITDIDGKYSIANIPADAKTLTISFIGMETQEVDIKPGEIKTYLKPDQKQLDEVVVVAYGTQKKSSFTGSAAAVGAETISKRAITNATSALEGNATGVQVTSASGQPGSSSSIRIRGFGSVNASNAPLYVVDGAIYSGSIGDINPNDIESMTILKDAASTSLYGSSAGNGVVLITTKKAKGGSNNVNLVINQGWSKRAYKDYSRVGIWDYYPMQWTMMKNAYVSAGRTAEEAAQLATANICDGSSGLMYNPYLGVANNAIVTTDGKLNSAITGLKWGDDLDWEDAAFKTGYRQEYNLNYNTKTDKSDTYASVSYLKDNGYMLKTNFERYSGRINYNIYPVKWFKSGLNLNMTRSISDYSTSTSSNSSSYSNLARFVRNMAPIYPIHAHNLETGAYVNKDGIDTTDPKDYIYDYEGNRLSDAGRHAIAETEFNTRKYARTSETANTYVTITPIDGLTGTVNYALANSDYRGKVYENPLVGDGTAGPGRLNQTSTRTITQTLNELINYNKTFGKHTIDALVGHENYSYKYEYIYGMKTQETLSGIYEFGNFVNINSLSSYTDNYKKEGYFGRINYDYDNKYYASISYRHDGSSRFAPDLRWGNFWSFGASWRMSQENFLKDVKWIDNLKLRASYGETGNDNILDSDGYDDYYPWQTLYNLGVNNGEYSGVFFNTMSNSNLRWETQQSIDAAVDFGFFNRVTGKLEFFQKNSKDLLFDVSQPSSTGVTSIIQNIGKIKNSGVEIELDVLAFQNKQWNVKVGANATFIKNKIVSLPEEMKENGHISGSKKWMEGKSMYEFWLRQWYGVNPENGDGLYYLDTEKYNEADGTLTAAAKKTIVEIDGQQLTNSYTYAKYDYSGASIPKMYGGFNFAVAYRDFDLSATFSYQLGGKILDTTYAGLMSMSSYGQSMSTDLFNAWQKEGDITSVPRIDANSTYATSIGQSYSTRWLVSSNYLNMRSLSIGYSVPKAFINHFGISNLRLTAMAENIFMLKARQGMNPMANYSGITYNEYMPSRNFTIGLNLSF